MVTENISRLLWEVASMMRGTFGANEYSGPLSGLLLLKFLSDNQDGEQSSVFILPSEAHWQNLKKVARTGNGLPEVFNQALNALEQHPDNHSLQGVFTALGTNRLAQQPEMLRSVILQFSELDLRQLTGSDASELLEALTTFHGRGAGEFYTPTVVGRLLAELLNPRAESSIYDPACGTANLLLQAYNVAGNETLKKAQLYGQEVSELPLALAKVNMVLHAIADAHLVHGNTLWAPQFTENASIRTFDYVISNPPMGQRLSNDLIVSMQNDKYNRFAIAPRQRADTAWLMHIVASLNNKGRAVILLPAALLFLSGIEGEVRRELVGKDIVEAVITLPNGLLLNSMVSTAILVLNKDKPENLKRKILFVLANSEFKVQRAKSRSKPSTVISQELYERIIRAVLTQEQIPRFSRLVTNEDLKETNFNLSPGLYIDLINRESLLGGSVKWEPLQNLADLISFGTRSQASTDGGSTPVIRGRDLSSPQIKLDNLETTNVQAIRGTHVYTQVGDLLLQRIGASPKAYVVDDEMAGVLVHDTVYLVRLAEAHRDLGQFMSEFINSEIGQAMLAARTGTAGAPTLSLTDLKTFSVPIPEKRVTRLVRELRDVERDLLGRITKARDLRQKLFAIDNPHEAAQQLQLLGVEAQVLGNSLLQLDDLTFQIRNTYPFPLAYTYRTLDAIPDLAGRYKAQLRVAENFLAFLGSLGIVLVSNADALNTFCNPMPLDEYVRELWGGGISPGDWRELGRRSGETLRERNVHALGNKFASLWFKGNSKKESDFAKRTKYLIELKNASKHDRGPETNDEYRDAIRQLEGHLEVLYKEVAFLTQHPIRLVQDLDISHMTGEAIISTLVYVGDHPGLKQERITRPYPLPKNTLHIEVDEAQWLSLYPFISVHTCSSCQTRETYMIDAWIENRGTKLKSFERGHSKAHKGQSDDADDEAIEIGQALSYWLSKV